MDFPHDQHGGWPDVDPTDAFVTYAQIPADDGGFPAMATGSSVIKRTRGVALALVMTAAILRPDVLTDETVRNAHDGLSHWIAEAAREFAEWDAQTIGRVPCRSRSRSRNIVDRVRPSSLSELEVVKEKLRNAELALKQAGDDLKLERLSNASLVRALEELQDQVRSERRGTSSAKEN